MNRTFYKREHVECFGSMEFHLNFLTFRHENRSARQFEQEKGSKQQMKTGRLLVEMRSDAYDSECSTMARVLSNCQIMKNVQSRRSNNAAVRFESDTSWNCTILYGFWTHATVPQFSCCCMEVSGVQNQVNGSRAGGFKSKNTEGSKVKLIIGVDKP